MADLFGTIDIGSTNCKIGIFDEEANFLYRDDSPISSQLLRRSGTIDPFEIWETVSGLLGRLPERIKRRLRALCVIGQGPTVVPVDRSGQPLYRAITWLDGRGKERIPVLIDQGVDPQLAAGLSALEWLKEELSEQAVLLQPADYVAYRLTGRLANMSFPFVGYLPWSRQALEEREWAHAFLVPEIVEPGQLMAIGGPAAQLKPHLEESFGMRCTVPEHAMVANALGAALARTTRQITLTADTQLRLSLIHI